MDRCKQLVIALAFACAMFSAAPTAAADKSDVILAQQTAPTATLQDWVANIKVQHVIAVGVGAIVGDMFHSAVGLPGGAAFLLGGVAGYYVYVNYIENSGSPTAQKINAVADEARLYLAAARDTVVEMSNEYLGAR